jgi:glycosyltransferase involved in cell wall biosynthesis
MKILLCSYRFSPGVGGIETVGGLLAENFVRLGHEVRVVTESGGEERPPNASYEILRMPAPRKLAHFHRWSDVVLCNQFSTKFVWPGIGVRRPIFIIHHTFPAQDPNRLRRFFKLQLCRIGTNLAVSNAVSRSLPFRCIRVHNPFRYDLFRSAARSADQRDCIFVGRLIPEKKVDDLLRALTRSAESGVERAATIVGEGADRARLEQLADGLPVRFVGTQTGRALAELLAAHRYLVLPSSRNETFGLVVVEAIAAGCIAIGSDHGGIPEAIGPCGALFPPGDVAALAKLLMRPPIIPDFDQLAAQHLAPYHPERVAREYLGLFEKELGSRI